MTTAEAVIVKNGAAKLRLGRRYGYRVTGGPHEGIVFVASDGNDLDDSRVGNHVSITFEPADQFACRVKVAPKVIPLKTPAVTMYGSEHTSKVAAHVRIGADGKPVLVIEGTPGQWRVSTLIGVDSYGGFALKRPHDEMAIDFGRSWILCNLPALLSEALARLLGEDPS